MPITKTGKTESRLNFRLPSEAKQRIEKAAVVSGLTVTDFAVHILVSRANEVLERHHTRQLSDRDRDIFLEMLKNPPEPNEVLRKAVKEYKKRVKK